MEAETWTGTGNTFGYSTASTGNGYFSKLYLGSFVAWYAYTTQTGSAPFCTKHFIEFGDDHLKLDGTSIGQKNVGQTYPTKGTAYLGALNYQDSPQTPWTGTIYKFLWYEEDTLVQAWIGNENGGFDIYSDEDIELQENDRKFDLRDYYDNVGGGGIKNA